ncbi:hypothetical protein MIR68_003913 [Amoeboaphelidium protococcarum]|nr:hypothetical protein MIR68_012216 [Amoeboaphelidium protococcarum]KAI3638302.1 hypothetical protein MIR68_003913 [Amoeboaphelidium protococcarum]KAI3652765.1 hypothetical protein MP228_002190 [Amoeboaphelidium protococcarum]
MSTSASLSPSEQAAQKELQQFLLMEQQKAKFQQQVHTFTSMCWEKCPIGSVSAWKLGSKLDKADVDCLGNCVERFLDTGALLLKRLEQYGG